MFYSGFEIPVGQILQFLDQRFTLTVRNVSGKEQTVDQQTEFCICETSDEAKHYAAAKGIPTLYFVGEDIVEVRV